MAWLSVCAVPLPTRERAPTGWSDAQKLSFVDISARGAFEFCSGFTLIALGLQSYVRSRDALDALGSTIPAPVPAPAPDGTTTCA